MVGVAEALIQCFHAVDLYIRGYNKAVDHIILRQAARAVKRLIEQPAGRRGRVIGIAPAGGQIGFQQAGRPFGRFLERIARLRSREALVEIAARNDIVALFIFLLKDLQEQLCLRSLALAVVIGLQMQVDDDQLLLDAVLGLALDGKTRNEQATLEVRNAQRPLKGRWQAVTRGAVIVLE